MKLYYETSHSLSHHGIKGQKWGVRRFQNKDGTLTAKGKKRYKDTSEDVKSMSNEELQSRINRLRNEQKYIDLTKKSSKISRSADSLKESSDIGSNSVKTNKNISKLKGKDTTSYDLVGNGFKTLSKTASATKKIDKLITEPIHVKKSKEKLTTMTDDELRNIVTRLDLEKQYSDVSRNYRNRGQIKVREIIDVVGDMLAITASATTIAVVGKKLLESKLDTVIPLDDIVLGL